MKQSIKIVHYKAGNIASVMNALARLGVRASLATRPEDLRHTHKLIFPGVGHARPAMEALQNNNMDQAICDFRGPVLGICLGMQLMAGQSEEGNTRGLQIFNSPILRFNHQMKVPHMGWNNVHGLKGPIFANIPEDSCFYFVHSFYMPAGDQAIGLCQYGDLFTAAAARDNFFGVQFHPEKSGEAGNQLLKNFIQL